MRSPIRGAGALVVLAAACFALPAGAAVPDSTALGRAIDACVAPLVRAGELSGQLLIAHGHDVLVERTWGWADRERHVAMAPTTRMSIASITKPVNQAVLIRMLEEKTLALEDTIGRFLPGFPYGGRITVGHLMGHESGIPHRVTTDAEEVRPITAAQITERAGRTPLQFEPGSQSSYSSAGYTVLAHVMETAAGRPWADLARERVIGPAGLAHTVPSAGLADPLPERAVSYLPDVEGSAPAPRKDLGFLAGAGSMWSTARDLHGLAMAVADGRLGGSVRASLLRRGGLRWSGSTNGFFSYLDYDTTTAMLVVFVGNLHSGAPALLHAALPKLVAGESVTPLVVPGVTLAKVPERTLKRYEGSYDVANNKGLQVRAKGGVLWVDEWVLRPTSDSTFFSPRDYGSVTTARDSTGALAGLNWIQGGRPFLCPRTGPLAKDLRVK